MNIVNDHFNTITLPSGRVIKMREPNANDEGVLSNVELARDSSNVINFLANIVMEDSFLGRKPLVEDIKEWKRNDIYWAMFKQRVIYSGFDFIFNHECYNRDCKHKFVVEEDLRMMAGDFEELSDEDNKKVKIWVPGYPNKEKTEITFTTDKRTFRFKNLTLPMENAMLKISASETNINAPAMARELEELINDKWVLVKDFGGISRSINKTIRTQIKKEDTQFLPNITIDCPKCEMAQDISMFTIPGFYYPEDLI